MSTATSLSQVIFKLSTGDMTEEINLKPEAWRVLTQINGTRSVAEIAKGVGMDEPVVTQIADFLFKAGVLEVAEGSVAPPRASVDSAFFDQVIRELARAMGPLAEVIIDDEIDKLGETRQRFPHDRIPDLVEGVSAAIRDEAKRLKFQQVMLEAIRKL
jgi:hypothetical protein